jgi:hypothetical protein
MKKALLLLLITGSLTMVLAQDKVRVSNCLNTLNRMIDTIPKIDAYIDLEQIGSHKFKKHVSYLTDDYIDYKVDCKDTPKYSSIVKSLGIMVKIYNQLK